MIQIPQNLEGFLQYVKKEDKDSVDLFPVKSYEKLPEVMNVLNKLFHTTILPSYLNELQDLPKPARRRGMHIMVMGDFNDNVKKPTCKRQTPLLADLTLTPKLILSRPPIFTLWKEKTNTAQQIKILHKQGLQLLREKNKLPVPVTKHREKNPEVVHTTNEHLAVEENPTSDRMGKNPFTIQSWQERDKNWIYIKYDK
ncbi:38796_t:CDS:2 [Gigaspora margarita]|uniref:38796_t:CDS:1 n=1 Tax=Gigaspora margarita TaxID=4874 RepID=A0ABN7UZI0_GIGMA|nr:38796_t:CDS:2 [Gigaspora margarita]